VLSIFIAVTYMMTWSIVPQFLKLMIQLSSQVRPIGLFLLFFPGFEFGFSLNRSLLLLLTALVLHLFFTHFLSVAGLGRMGIFFIFLFFLLIY
jgi:hypothetical protein